MVINYIINYRLLNINEKPYNKKKTHLMPYYCNGKEGASNMSIIEPMNETVTISSGRIQGIRLKDDGAIAWLGVPYAKPPVDQLRWKAPRAAEPWSGVLPVKDFRSSSVQSTWAGPSGSEDCLYLNIWRPDHDATGLPVFVFLHGGGNVAGSGRDFQGGLLASETHSIIVTVNYRLGALGFFRHPALRTGNLLDDSGNYGLLDILHSLRWVQTNLSSFGGNPDNVTLAGQSAGARNALAAYLSPLGKGLFHKLFVMSGGLTTAAPEQGDAKANDILAALLIKTGTVHSYEEARDWIVARPMCTISEFLYEQKAIDIASTIGETGLRMTAFPHLFEDGTVIPVGGFESLKNREHPCLPIVLGSTASEFSGFALMDPYFSPLVQTGRLALEEEHKSLYEAAVQYGSELYASFNVEQVADKLFDTNPEMSIFGYRFAWGLQDGVMDPSIRFLLGASHGADIPFYTGDYSPTMQNFPAGMITGHNEPGRRFLSSLMRGYLQRFIHSGDPNGDGVPVWNQWTANSESAEILRFDASADQALVHLEMKLNINDILSSLENDSRLSADQRSWLRNNLFADRFFWKK
jgi:para-nitrobenzyl esterase